MNREFQSPKVTAIELTGIKPAGKPMKDECAAVKLTPKELIAGNVHYGVSEGLILDFPDDHRIYPLELSDQRRTA